MNVTVQLSTTKITPCCALLHAQTFLSLARPFPLALQSLFPFSKHLKWLLFQVHDPTNYITSTLRHYLFTSPIFMDPMI